MGKIFLALISLGLSASLDTSKVFLLGGAGDPLADNNTVFDQNYSNTVIFAKQAGWDLEARLDGGHAGTTAIMAQAKVDNPNQGPMNELAFKSSIEKMKYYAQTLPEGSRLLIIINSHGIPRLETGNELTHSIVSSTTSEPSTKTVSLDALKDVVAIASSRNLKVAVIDLSCYSGATQKLANKNTCVVSASSTDLLSFEHFTNRFVASMRKGENLEDVFLQARLASPVSSLPQISTSANNRIAELEGPGLSGFMRFKRTEKTDDLTKFATDEVETNHSCDGPLKRFQTWAAVLRSRLSRFPGMENDPDVIALYQLVEKYEKTQTEIESELLKQGHGVSNREVEVSATITDANGKPRTSTQKLTMGVLVNGEWSSNWAYAELAKAVTKRDKENARLDIAMLQACRAKKQSLLAQFPALANLKKSSEHFTQLIQSTENLTVGIGAAERKVYQKIRKGGTDQCMQEFCFVAL